MSAFYVPRVEPELQNGLPTSTVDCGPMTIQGLIRWATWAQLVPSVPAIRNKINAPIGGISMAQCLAAYKAYGVDALLVRTADEVKAALQAGKAVHAAISYGWVNTNAPELSGDPNFMGGHSLAFFGFEQVIAGGALWVMWLDPLQDGRRAGIPKQITMARWKVPVGAMAAYSAGTTAIVITQGPQPIDTTAAKRLAAKDAAFDVIISEAQGGKAA